MKNKASAHNIYDMTQVVEYRGKYYERLKDHPDKEKYRVTTSIASDDYDYVTNKTLVKKLDSIFKGVKDAN